MEIINIGNQVRQSSSELLSPDFFFIFQIRILFSVTLSTLPTVVFTSNTLPSPLWRMDSFARLYSITTTSGFVGTLYFGDSR